MIIVTGSSGGIGNEIVLYLSKQDSVIGIYNKTKPVNQQDSEKITFEKVNLLNSNEIKMFVKNNKKRLSSITIVHGAALSIDRLFINYKEEDWDSVINVNLKANFLLTKALLPIMLEEKWGRIISLSSIVGERGTRGAVAYSTSKTALTGMSRVLAKEYGRFNITSNILTLGYFKGGLINSLDEEKRKKIKSSIPLNRFGDIENIAHAINFLINSDYTNGATIHIDGGI